MKNITRWIAHVSTALLIAGCSANISEDEAMNIAYQHVANLVKSTCQDYIDISLIQSQEIVKDGWFFVYKINSLSDSYLVSVRLHLDKRIELGQDRGL
jgi:hypothetical protein